MKIAELLNPERTMRIADILNTPTPPPWIEKALLERGELARKKRKNKSPLSPIKEERTIRPEVKDTVERVMGEPSYARKHSTYRAETVRHMRQNVLAHERAIEDQVGREADLLLYLHGQK